MRALASYRAVPFQLSLWQKLVLSVGLIGLPLASLYSNLPLFVVPAIAGMLLAVVFFARPFFLLTVYIASIIVINFRSDAPGELGPMELFTGGMLILGLLYLFTLKLTGRKNIYSYSAAYWMILYVCWAVLGSFVSIINETTTFNAAFREFLAFSPIIVLPVLYREAHNDTPNFEQRFFAFLIILWVVVLSYSITHIRSSMLASTYLFQTSFRSVDVLNGSVMALVFLSLLSIERSKTRRIVYAIGSSLSFVGAILTFHRTGWVAIVIVIPLLLLLSSARERKVLLRYGIRIVGIGIVILGICIAVIPLAQSISLFFLTRFLSSSNVSSDVSLLGRFVEWRYVIAQIVRTPILGVGFGGQYYMYGWLVGYSMMTGYTHNGYLMLLLKGGIVGFAAMMIAQIKFFILGFNLARSPLLTDREKALAKVSVLALAIVFIEMQTLGFFIHREILWYVGLLWGVLSVAYEKTLERSSIQNALVE